MKIISGTTIQQAIKKVSINKVITLCLSFTLLLCSNTSFAYKKIDKVIAIIDDDVIFSSELDRRVEQFTARVEAQGQSVSTKTLRPKLLERLITERLQLNIAERNNISVSDTDIDKAINRTQNNLSRNGITFDQYLKAQNLTIADARKQLSQEILIDRIQKGVINARIKVTEKEIDNFLKSKAGQEWLTTRYQSKPATLRRKRER